jgi:carbonic anhydrase
MAQESEEELHTLIDDQYGIDTRSLEFKTVTDQRAALVLDVQRVRSYPLLRKGVIVGGAIYDVKTGTITPIDC